MKHLTFILLFLFSISCSAQEIPENVDGFADENYLSTNRENAKYYRIHKYIDDIAGISINPNATSNFGQIMPDEYGPEYNYAPTGIQNHEITFYNLKNQKVLVAGALMDIQKEIYELYGLATWYDEKGRKKETGFFRDNVRGNYFEEFDKNGNVSESGYYVKGKKFNHFKIDKRLLGKWRCKHNVVDEFGGSYPILLFNRFNKDGVIEIWNEVESEFDFLKEMKPSITRLHHSFEKTGENTGILTTIEYFTGNEDKENIEFIGENKMISTITKHSDPSLVGTSYTFFRVKK